MLVTDKIEKTAEVAIEVIDTVAEATEKVAGEVADAFPGNEDLKEAASKIKAVTDAIKEDADKAQALIHKVWLNYAIYCCLSTTGSFRCWYCSMAQSCKLPFLVPYYTG
jgi:hypothetical protein